MINKPKKTCYTDLIAKLEKLDIQICRVKEQMLEIRRLLQKEESNESTPPSKERNNEH